MLDQPIDEISEASLERLIANQVAESRSLDFKRKLPGGADADLKEFLADVTSFANAQGGDLVYGIEEAEGVATALPGMEVADAEAAILRLENVLRDGIAPRLIGVRMRFVPLETGNSLLVIRVPAGLAAPHRVTFRNHGRFYNRNSSGKFEMDVHDLRHAFTESGSLPGRFRQLHGEAIERATGHEMPLSISRVPTAVASVIPLSLFREERDIPITRDHAMAPIDPDGISSIEMIEGVLLHTHLQRDTRTVESFALTYRTGRVDVAWTIGGVRDLNGVRHGLVFPGKFENGILDALNSAQARLRQFDIEGPWVIFVSVYGVAGHKMILGDGYPTNDAYKDQALLSELRVERIDEATYPPIVHNFWLLFGLRRPDGRPLGG